MPVITLEISADLGAISGLLASQGGRLNLTQSSEAGSLGCVIMRAEVQDAAVVSAKGKSSERRVEPISVLNSADMMVIGEARSKADELSTKLVTLCTFLREFFSDSENSLEAAEESIGGIQPSAMSAISARRTKLKVGRMIDQLAEVEGENKNLVAVLDTISDRCRGLIVERDDTLRQIRLLSTALDSSKSETADLEMKCENVLQDIEIISRKYADAEEELRKRCAEIDELTVRCSSAEDARAQTNIDLDALNRHLLQVQGEKSALQSQLDSLMRSQNVSVDIARENSKLAASTKEQEAENQRLTSKLAKVMDSFKQLLAEKESFDEDRELTTRTVEDLSVQLDASQRQVQELTERLQGVDVDASDLSSRVEELEAENSRLTAQVADATSQLTDALSNLRSIVVAKDACDDQNEKLLDDLDIAKDQISRLTSMMESVAGERDVLLMEQDRLAEEMCSISEEKKSVTAQLAVAVQETEELKHHIDALQAEVQQLTEKLDSANQRITRRETLMVKKDKEVEAQDKTRSELLAKLMNPISVKGGDETAAARPAAPHAEAAGFKSDAESSSSKPESSGGSERNVALLEAQIVALTENVQKKAITIRDLTKALDNKTKELEDVHKQLAAATESAESLKGRLPDPEFLRAQSELVKDLESKVAELTSRCAIAEREAAATKQLDSGVSTQLKDAMSELDGLRRQVTTLKGQNGRLEDAIVTLESEKKALLALEQTLKQKVIDLESEKADLQTLNEDLSATAAEEINERVIAIEKLQAEVFIQKEALSNALTALKVNNNNS